jgi:hypothetical protein
MKFFTRDLYRRCQSRDEAVLAPACDEWEQANERYEQHMQALESSLPTNLRDFTSLLLHDARVLSIGRERNRLHMVLHKDIPPRDLVMLDYELDGEPMVEPFTDSPGDWSKPTDFQFDEIDVVTEGNRPVYCQSIVFSNGWVMHLNFRDVQVTLAHPVFPAQAGTGTVSGVLQPS